MTLKESSLAVFHFPFNAFIQQYNFKASGPLAWLGQGSLGTARQVTSYDYWVVVAISFDNISLSGSGYSVIKIYVCLSVCVVYVVFRKNS